MKLAEKLVALFVFFALILSSCTCNKIGFNNNRLITANNNEIFLYDPLIYKLGLYDTNAKRWEAIYYEGCLFQTFGWGNDHRYYIVGSEDNSNFDLIKTDGASLRLIASYSVDKDQSMSPFVTDSDNLYYMLETVTDSDYKKKIITLDNEGEMSVVKDLDGMAVMNGVIANGYLFFTTYNKNGTHSVWKDKLDSGTEQQPIDILDGYDTYLLYEYGSDVLFVDNKNNKLYNSNIIISLTHSLDSVYIDEDVNMVAEKYPDVSGHDIIVLSDIITGAVLGRYEDAINYRRNGLSVTIYGNGYIDHLDLKG